MINSFSALIWTHVLLKKRLCIYTPKNCIFGSFASRIQYGALVTRTQTPETSWALYWKVPQIRATQSLLRIFIFSCTHRRHSCSLKTNRLWSSPHIMTMMTGPELVSPASRLLGCSGYWDEPRGSDRRGVHICILGLISSLQLNTYEIHLGIFFFLASIVGITHANDRLFRSLLAFARTRVSMVLQRVLVE